MRVLTESQREVAKARSKAWHKANREVACARSVKWRIDNPERKRANDVAWRRANVRHVRGTKLKKKFNLTLAQYDTMLADQGGVCKICGGVNANGRQLSVDHNHLTKEVRGLLCIQCNLAMERVDGIPDWLRKAEAYIRGSQ